MLFDFIYDLTRLGVVEIFQRLTVPILVSYDFTLNNVSRTWKTCMHASPQKAKQTNTGSELSKLFSLRIHSGLQHVYENVEFLPPLLDHIIVH